MPNIQLLPFGLDSKDLTALVRHQYPIWINESKQLSENQYYAKLDTTSIHINGYYAVNWSFELKITQFSGYYFFELRTDLLLMVTGARIKLHTFTPELLRTEIGNLITEYITDCEKALLARNQKKEIIYS